MEEIKEKSAECECCQEIKILKQLNNKDRYKFYATIVSITKNGKVSHSMFDLNYCPMCGRKLV